jgi:hypothetical protein
MRRFEICIVALLFVLAGVTVTHGEPAAGVTGDRYVLVNVRASEVSAETFKKIAALRTETVEGAPRLGVGVIFSYFRQSRDTNLAHMRSLFELCQQYDLAVIVQLDGEQWWQRRPDLWNWWDASKPGFDPANASNVEWSGWGPEHALKIAWRNWGQQLRVSPPPNLMSPRYRDACHTEMQPLLATIIRWRDSLPADKKWLLAGVKVGWESAIGMGSHYYPDGNSLLDKDPANDPRQKAKPGILPGRGFQPIGYAAVTTAGLASSGELKEADLAEVVRRHLADLSKAVRTAGLPRAQVFTHCGGWAEGELLYRSALNDDACPGWSFYRHGRDPRGDKTAMQAVAASDAPYWAAVEWLPIGAKTSDDWRNAISNTLTADRCRYLCIYNWREIEGNEIALGGIRGVLAKPLRTN